MSCPACCGPVLPGHPGGWLAIRHQAACYLYEAESQTHAADLVRLDTGTPGPNTGAHPAIIKAGVLRRSLTPAEIELLTAFGHAPGENTVTHVSRVTRSVLHRSWPDLEPEDDEPEDGDDPEAN